jgi:hypothetical protein
MKSVFNENDNNELIDRINRLTPDTQPLWGKMSVAQMLGHCQRAVEVGTGLLELRRTAAGYIFGRMALKQLMNKPIGKNIPTDKSFIIPPSVDFEPEKQKLIEAYKALAEHGTSHITHKKHPFFGTMTTEEWDTLLWKHLDHHLQQFGV